MRRKTEDEKRIRDFTPNKVTVGKYVEIDGRRIEATPEIRISPYGGGLFGVTLTIWADDVVIDLADVAEHVKISIEQE